MDNENSVLLIKDYGRIHIKLKQALEKRGMNRNELSRAIGSRFEVVDKWYNGTLGTIDSDVLARICYVLNCKVEDLIEYEE